MQSGERSKGRILQDTWLKRLADGPFVADGAFRGRHVGSSVSGNPQRVRTPTAHLDVPDAFCL
jgi:hypothetical protein